MASDSVLGRGLAAGFDWWQLAGQVTETMLASQMVIATRLTMIGNGLSGRGRLPMAEMARMGPEKLVAFGRASSGAARHALPFDAGLWTAPLDAGVDMLELWERSLAASLAWWQPLHARSTANARRLARRRRWTTRSKSS